MDAHDTAAFKKHIRIYVGVFIALLVGTVITVAVSYVHFGHAGNITVAMVIAVAKAALVAGFFMHLVSERRPIYRVLVATGIFFAGLMALTIWAMHDMPELTESTQTAPLVHEASSNVH